MISMPVHPLTPRQQEVLAVIAAHVDTYGYAPSLREISASIGSKHVGGCRYHLQRLETLGYIARDSGVPRSIRMIQHDVRISVDTHEVKLPPWLDGLPVKVSNESKHALCSAIKDALYGTGERPVSTTISVAETSGRIWRVDVEPFDSEVAMTLWEAERVH